MRIYNFTGVIRLRGSAVSTSKVILALVAMLAICACSTAPVGNPIFSGLEDPQDDEAIVYFYRLKSFTGGGVTYSLHINQEKVSSLPNCSFTFIRLPSGNYTLSTKSKPSFSQKPDPIDIKVESGDRQFYVLDIDGSFKLVPIGSTVVSTSSVRMAWRNTSMSQAIEHMSGCYWVEAESM